MSPHRPGEWNVALVGACSLLGKEGKSVLEARGLPLGRLALLDSEAVQGQLTEFGGEPAVWLWGVFDNWRIAALHVGRIAEDLLRAANDSAAARPEHASEPL